MTWLEALMDIQPFFTALWNTLGAIRIPIIDVSAKAFLVGTFLISFSLKILAKVIGTSPHVGPNAGEMAKDVYRGKGR